MLPKIIALVLLVVVGLGFWRFCGYTDLPAAGKLRQPIQKQLAAPKQLNAPQGFSIKATHTYDIKALILSRRSYPYDRWSKLSPVDFALGWGVVTMGSYINKVRYKQYGRWYHFRYSGDFPFPGSVISKNSANTHIIPEAGNQGVWNQLTSFRRGQLVRLKGYLVQVKGPKGGRWISSTTRDDIRGGACEVFYVTKAEALPLPTQ